MAIASVYDVYDMTGIIIDLTVGVGDGAGGDTPFGEFACRGMRVVGAEALNTMEEHADDALVAGKLQHVGPVDSGHRWLQGGFRVETEPQEVEVCFYSRTVMSFILRGHIRIIQ